MSGTTGSTYVNAGNTSDLLKFQVSLKRPISSDTLVKISSKNLNYIMKWIIPVLDSSAAVTSSVISATTTSTVINGIPTVCPARIARVNPSNLFDRLI